MKTPCRSCTAKDKLLEIAASESSATANSMLAWTDALSRGDFTTQAAREHVLRLMEARITSHLAVLERLLDASTPPSRELSLIRLDMHDVVSRALESHRELAAERSVRLPAYVPSIDGAVVLGDRRRIARAISDLLVECIRSADVSSGIGVEISLEPTAAAVQLTIASRRTSVDETRVGVVAAGHDAFVHGGSLAMRADGFVLRLPLFEPAGAAARTAPGKTLLVVRHESDIAEILAALATASGHRVVTVHDEELAARAFEVHAPDVVVVGSPDGLDRLGRLLVDDRTCITTVSSAAEARALVNGLGESRPGERGAS